MRLVLNHILYVNPNDKKRVVTICKLHCEVRGVSFAGFSQHRSVLPDRNALRNPQRQLASDR